MQRVSRTRPGDGVDAAVAELAGAQHGVVAHRQLVALGLSAEAVQWRLQAKRLHRLHKGVYLVGHAELPPRGREMAAQLACAPCALISHRSAGRLWELLRRRSGSETVDVTVVGRHPGHQGGIRVLTTRDLLGRDAVRQGHLWLTTPARTLLDLAACSDDSELENAIAQARRRELIGEDDLADQIARNRGRRGVARMRRVLALEGGPALTRSPPERRLLEAIRASSLPIPETNQVVCGFEVDLLWREHRLVVEFDGRAFHSDPLAFETDRARDAILAANGYTVIRITHRQLTTNAEATLHRLRLALTNRPRSRNP